MTTYTLPLYREPQRLSEQVNQVFLGRTVRLLKPSDKGDYVLCEAPGGYIGWAPVQVIKRINATEVKQWRLHYPRFLFTAEYVQKSGKATINIPMGADLPIIAKNRPTALTEQTVLLPDGRRLNVPVHYGRIINPEPEKARAKLLDIVKKLKDTPYVWGGISIKGLDCSGFTNLIYRLRGVPLPRDADQQSAVGEIVAFRGFRQGLLPGDLLFFASRFGRISHMAVSLGGDEFAHSHRNGVHIASFNPSQENYNEELDKRFVFARRILIDGF